MSFVRLDEVTETPGSTVDRSQNFWRYFADILTALLAPATKPRLRQRPGSARGKDAGELDYIMRNASAARQFYEILRERVIL
jgi:hypothetical protein